MLLDLVHLRLVEPALRIGRQAVGEGEWPRYPSSQATPRVGMGDTSTHSRTDGWRPVGVRSHQLSGRMPTGANPFKGREESIDEPLGIAAQVAQDARLGDQDGVDGKTQLGGTVSAEPRR